MSLESFFAEDPRYERWILDHPDGLVARVGILDGGLGIHRVWCARADPGESCVGGMEGVRLCADRIDELNEWAGRRMVASLSQCERCSSPHLEVLHHL